jgi:hypothetical protein
MRVQLFHPPTLVNPIYLEDRLNFCDHMKARQLTWWKYRLAANFYLVAWATHPTRPFRIAANAIRGRQTSTMEKFLGDMLGRAVRHLPLRGRRTRGGAQPALPY